MIKPNHPIAAFSFVILLMPLFLLGIAVGLAWRSVKAGCKAVDKFIEWM